MPAITARLIVSRLDIPMTTRPRPGMRAAAKNRVVAARARTPKKTRRLSVGPGSFWSGPCGPVAQVSGWA